MLLPLKWINIHLRARVMYPFSITHYNRSRSLFPEDNEDLVEDNHFVIDLQARGSHESSRYSHNTAGHIYQSTMTIRLGNTRYTISVIYYLYME